MKLLDEIKNDEIRNLKDNDFTIENIEKIVKRFYNNLTFVDSEEEAKENYKKWGYLNDTDGNFDDSIHVFERLSEERIIYCNDENVSYQKTAKIRIYEYYTDPGMQDYQYKLRIDIY